MKSKKVKGAEADRSRVYEAITAKFGARLRPGEGLSVSLEQTAEHVCLEVVLESMARDFRLSLESAAVEADEEMPRTKEDRLRSALDFLDVQLEEFFDSDRELRFHQDWRRYEVEGEHVRFRGAVTNPMLEDAATEFLKEHDGHGWDV